MRRIVSVIMKQADIPAADSGMSAENIVEERARTGKKEYDGENIGNWKSRGGEKYICKKTER